MDSELLENASELLVKGILAQDVTYYVDLLAPDVTLNILYGKDTLPLPQDDDSSRDNNGATDDVQPAKPAAPSGPNDPAAPSSALPPGIVSTECTTTTGPKAFAEATFRVFTWMQRGKHVVEPRVAQEPRRPRKDAGNAAASPPKAAVSSPRKGSVSSAAAAANSWRSPLFSAPAERLQRLQNCSKLTVVWGRVDLQLRDEIYFEDGVIAVVDRFLVAPEDPSKPQYLADRLSFLGETKTRVDTRANHPPVLDFTFAEVNEVMDLLRVKPANGRLHKCKSVEQVQTKAEKSSALFQMGQKANATGKVMVKAKNKKGEEEAYEFAEERGSRAIKAEKEQKDDIISKLAEQLSGKYEAEAFRLTNNAKIRDVTQLVPVLRSLIANSFLTLSWIDISNNAISQLSVDLTQLPLSTLYLHGNHISDWSVVDHVVCQLPCLSSVTLYGNPLAQQPHYKKDLLNKLLLAPARSVPLKQIDFVALSTQDVVVSAMHDALNNKKGGSGALMAMAKQSVAQKSPRGIISPRKSSAAAAATVYQGSISSTSGGATSPRR